MRIVAAFVCALAMTIAVTASAQDTTPAPNAEAALAEETPAVEASGTPAALITSPGVDPATLTPEQREYLAQATAFYESLHRQTGTIHIADGKVALNIPQTHYFVGREDARRIIVEVWGNPPASAEGVEGIIFLAGANPAIDAWGALVQYVGDGYVPDDEANTINYADLLRDMQAGTRQENEWRTANNYPTIELAGWAETPSYDAVTHKLYWAKDLIFGGEGLHSLNYDIRVLGREGHLVVSFVSTMDQLETIRADAPAVMAMANFTAGNTYADYVAGVDQRAAYGIGGLIAGGALVAAAQKGGLLAILLALGKKFIVLLLAGLAAIGGAISRMFGRKDQSGS